MSRQRTLAFLPVLMLAASCGNDDPPLPPPKREIAFQAASQNPAPILIIRVASTAPDAGEEAVSWRSPAEGSGGGLDPGKDLTLDIGPALPEASKAKVTIWYDLPAPADGERKPCNPVMHCEAELEVAFPAPGDPQKVLLAIPKPKDG